MKRLVCADEVKAAAEKGQRVLAVTDKTIITPAARDLAKELGVAFSTETIAAPPNICQGQQTIDRDVIYQIVKAVLTHNLLAGVPALSPAFLSEGDDASGLKIVRGRTVTYEPFDTGTPGTKVAYREVISKDNSQMSAGFLTIEKSSFDWELCYEEIDIVLEGSLSVTINGKTYEASQGDVLFVPKGSKVTWSSSGYVKLFYVTYPANWAEQLAQP
ncbi:cupin domain-containing protein [Desulforamulus ferrireducens]|uniref:Ethanolamine utilization protein EutQ n=1 Tax=Desulforamulus ferrireducens TaxID=1833852 RepID=A0A1S6ISE8_9FIRM|nr:cupin domain-containing protein [Desulforamulus ferrireducens]AQS57694.1 ethanolamine utilization protein EutQ [Desulforamulus ferrireducens]